MKTFDRLIDEAIRDVDESMCTDVQFAHIHAQAAIANALIAIAQELKRHNDENGHDCLETIRQEILEREE